MAVTGIQAVELLHNLSQGVPVRIKRSSLGNWKQYLYDRYDGDNHVLLGENSNESLGDEVVSNGNILVDIKKCDTNVVEIIKQKSIAVTLDDTDLTEEEDVVYIESRKVGANNPVGTLLEIPVKSLKKHFIYNRTVRGVEIYKENAGIKGEIGILSSNGKAYIVCGITRINTVYDFIHQGILM